MKKLVIAEKPSLASKIISALYTEKFTRADGYSEGTNYIISFAFGHLFGLIDLDDYFAESERRQKWSMDILPFFPGQNTEKDYRFELLTKKEKGRSITDPGVKKQFEILKSLMNRSDVDEIIHCGDADREGEVIIRLILQKGLNFPKRVMRLWLPDQNEDTIRNALKNMKPDSEYDMLYREGLARCLIDWLYGINLTRYVTLKTPENETYSIGRVLTPVVKIIYDREMEIDSFVPQKYLQIESCTEQSGMKIKFTVPEKFNPDGEKEEAEKLIRELNAADAKVTDIQRKIRKKQPGKLFSLSKLQGFLGKKYKMPMDESLAIVQALYEKGLVTYPRTNTEYLSENEKDTVKAVISKINENFAGVSLTFKDSRKIFDNTKIESHSALTPTGRIPGKLSETEQAVYDTIYNRFCSVFCSEECEAEEVIVKVSCASREFFLKGETIIKEGFLRFEPLAIREGMLPPFTPGEKLWHKFELVEKFTNPPKRYNTETLGSRLKNPFSRIDQEANPDEDDSEEYKAILNGVEIGTEATRTAIISNAMVYGYISQKNDIYKLEKKGAAMIKYLDLLHIDISLQTSVEMQIMLKDVYHGRKTLNEILKKTEKQVREAFGARDDKIESMYVGEDTRKKIGNCPKCGKSIYETPKAFSCEDKACEFALWKENKYFDSIGFKLTTKKAIELLKTGKTKAEKLPSKKKPGQTYSAIITADFSGRYPRFAMEFESKPGNRKYKK